ncbi:cell surface protein [Ichthyenterobacterium sp. W332]|uniref:Cell surface protein n=1 Tax=Microcosmobacter mediterraneus TaxID=3075607 RepID=A0ABU2YLU5_9FLAO|nr:cell surface protein [Ichthyenterobacterium sp. W332]MDT0559131.1 cell surface protein [Ichthyenterobacterium sp. W332]
MKTIINILILFLLGSLLQNCATENEKITSKEDYNTYLNSEKQKSLEQAIAEYKFWEEKLDKTPNQFPYIAKMAAAKTQLFTATGEISHLNEAEALLLNLNKKTKFENAGYLRSLARNYISQHQFSKALEALLKAEKNGENLEGTQKMLFDVYLELGNISQAKHYLLTIKNFSDFDYLIRLSKYNDHEGDLDAAITYLEKAKTIAESSNIDSAKQWTYTNLADYYGHAGRIKDSYNHYLKALKIDPEDAYAKKGIAWIVYSYERNPGEALRILNSISNNHNTPDYALLKAEILEFMENDKGAEEQLNTFQDQVANVAYGEMYNAYKIELWAEDPNTVKDAITLAEKEIKLRPTAQAYDLLAWSYFKNNEVDKAYKLINEHVIGHTFEPVAQFHIAKILKAKGQVQEAKKIKKELLSSLYELGPTMEQDIKSI